MKLIIVLIIATILGSLWMLMWATAKTSSREYQIRLESDSTYIYDGKRLVGVMPYDSTQVFDKIMLRDNL